MLARCLLSTVELVDGTYDDRRVVAVCYTSVNCNPTTPFRDVIGLHYFDLLWICDTACSYSCS